MTDREALEAGIAWLKGRYERHWKGQNRDREIAALIAAAEYRLEHMPMRGSCRFCGQQVPDTRRVDAKFCSDAHRERYKGMKRKQMHEDAERVRYAAYLDSL